MSKPTERVAGEMIQGLQHATEKLAGVQANRLARAKRLFGEEAQLEPVYGDLLPAIGSAVYIHLASQDQWARHTVTGYYAWPDLNGNPSLQRVFVRVRDEQGNPNARLLEEVRLTPHEDPEFVVKSKFVREHRTTLEHRLQSAIEQRDAFELQSKQLKASSVSAPESEGALRGHRPPR